MGFVKVEGFEKDIYVGKRDTLNAMDGDTVYVQFTKNSTRGPEGVVVDIIERRFKDFIGVIKKRKSGYCLQIKGKYSYLTIVINQKHLKNAKINEVVKATIIDYGNGFLLKAKVDKVLGDKNQVGMDISMMIENAGISTQFSEETKNQAENFTSVVNKENRLDRTNEMIVTIDGDDAKDFDDAISVKKLADNKYMLGVYIADVSHYVTYNSPIDLDASLRTSSCYLPDRVVPMLPFRLSDDLCSLKPNVDRYALACEMIIENGKVIITPNSYYKKKGK
jgi:ribonuclease R